MNSLIDEISSDIEWRVTEISNLRTIPFRYNLNQQHRDTFLLYLVPALYSLWEGYVRNTFEVLTNHLNTLNLNHYSVHINLLTHTFENQFKLGNERKHFSKKKKFVNNLKIGFDSQLKIVQGIPTESNLNFKVTNNILERFNINPLEESYKLPLDKFLLFRNKIAHGENSILITKDHINNFSLLVQNLMYDIIIKIEDYIYNEYYKKEIDKV